MKTPVRHEQMKILPGTLLFYSISCWLFVCFSSCLSIRQGYIRHTAALEQDFFRGLLDSDSVLHRAQEEKEVLFEEAHRLLGDITASPGSPVSAQKLNHLYSNLRENIRHDSLLHALARCGEKREALGLLLASAGEYNSSYRQSKPVRRIINRGNSSIGLPGGFLNKTQRFLLTPSLRKSIAGSAIPEPATRASLAALTGFMIWRHGDRIHQAGYEMVNQVSKIFGNLAGAIRTRPNHTVNPAVLEHYLRPLDIILVKSETHLTDKFIPGYFGHAAIWTGTASMLEEMGAWTRPEMAPFRVPLFEGQTFAEGLRSGVRLSSLKRFADGDIYLVVRADVDLPEEKSNIITRVMSHLYKNYDFNFDLESSERIFCTELIYLAFDDLAWQTRKTWGRFTMSPDDIFLSSAKIPALRPVVLITPGGIYETPSPATIRRILGQ